jgi:hypothetical protein
MEVSPPEEAASIGYLDNYKSAGRINDSGSRSGCFEAGLFASVWPVLVFIVSPILMEQALENRFGSMVRSVTLLSIVVAGVFCLFVIVMLGVAWAQQKAHHPLVEVAAGRIAELRRQLQSRPADEQLKEQIRQTDVALRSAYWTAHARMRSGAWLLLGGCIVMVAGTKILRQMDRRQIEWERLRAPDRGERRGTFALAAVTTMGGAITLLLLGGAWWSAGHPVIDVPITSVAATETPATTEQFLAQWPVFRGFGGAAVTAPDPSVRSWDGAAGTNVLWHTAVPAPGPSSPIIWNDRVILTGATANQRTILAFDLGNGKLLWQTVIGADGAAPNHPRRRRRRSPTARGLTPSSPPVTSARSIWRRAERSGRSASERP